MRKRAYTHIIQYEPLIQSMRDEGMIRQKMVNEQSLTKEQIKKWMTRYNHQQSKLRLGIEHKSKSRTRNDGQALKYDPQKEIERLRMENKLLRVFM